MTWLRTVPLFIRAMAADGNGVPHMSFVPLMVYGLDRMADRGWFGSHQMARSKKRMAFQAYLRVYL